MRVKTYLGALGVLLLVLMTSSMMWPVAYQVQPVSASRSSEARVEAARMFVKLANQTVERILRMASANNVSINTSMAVEINETLGMLGEAWGEAEEDPMEAVNTTLKALEVFKPVSQYVLSQLGVGPGVDKEALIKAIDRHVELLEDLEKKINETVEKQGVQVPPSIYANLTELKNTLLKIRGELQAGNITVSQAARSIGVVRMVLARSTHRIFANISRMAFRLRSMGMVIDRISIAVIAVEKAVNLTLIALENNRTSMAVSMLDNAVNAIDKALNTSIKVEVFGEKHGIDTISVLSTVNESLVEVKKHLTAAKEDLVKGDKLNAVKELEAAQEKLSQLLGYLKDHLHGFHGKLADMMRRCYAMHEKLEREARRHGMHRDRPTHTGPSH